MQRREILSITAASTILLSLSTPVVAALSSPSDAHVSFEAAGPAGMKIDGNTPELTVGDNAGNIVITVPLGNLTTGIGLRDHHMKEKYLEVQKYPATTLTIPRSALKFPQSGQEAESDVNGTLQLHGQPRPVSVHYSAKGDGAGYGVRGRFHVNMNDFGITVPVYLGVTVKPDVDVNASFHVAGN